MTRTTLSNHKCVWEPEPCSKPGNEGRYLCPKHWKIAKNTDVLDEYPRRNVGRNRIEDYLDLKAQGENFSEIARRLNVKPDTLKRTLYRYGIVGNCGEYRLKQDV